MKKNQHHSTKQTSTRDRRTLILQIVAMGLLLPATGCDNKHKGTAALENGNANSPGASTATTEAGSIIERYRALDKDRDGTTKLRATISTANGGSEFDGPRRIQFNMYRKHQ